MRDRWDPRALDIAALCRDGAALEGAAALSELSRLAASLHGTSHDAAAVGWTAQAWLEPVTGGEPERWLRLTAQAQVGLQCQRCLQALPQTIVVERRFRFVRTEAEAERLDEELEDDVLVMPPRLDLLELLEDELLLGLPLVPRHEPDCPQPLPRPAAAPAGATPAPNPFAKLAALRTAPGNGGDEKK